MKRGPTLQYTAIRFRYNMENSPQNVRVLRIFLTVQWTKSGCDTEKCCGVKASGAALDNKANQQQSPVAPPSGDVNHPVEQSNPLPVRQRPSHPDRPESQDVANDRVTTAMTSSITSSSSSSSSTAASAAAAGCGVADSKRDAAATPADDDVYDQTSQNHSDRRHLVSDKVDGPFNVD